MSNNFNSVMIDVETTGTSPDKTAIIQIAAVRFDLETRTVDSGDMFNRCLSIPPTRYWDEGTREWWGKQKRSILQEIYSRMEDPKTVMTDFSQWALSKQNGQKLHFWAKPTSFDFTFCQSYFNEFEVYNPFHFREAIDMNSFIRGLGRSSEKREVEVEFAGDAHNAIFDVLNQISVVFKSVEEIR